MCVCVCWDSLAGLCAYVAQWEKQMVRSANFITIQGLTPNKTYYIRVLAFTSVGDGPLSQDLQIIAKTGGEGKEIYEMCKILNSYKRSDLVSLMLLCSGCSSIPTFRL